MCIYNYKFRSLFPSSILSGSIERSTNKLKITINSVEMTSSQVNALFEQLKKANVELTKLAVQTTRLKEKPKLKDLYKEKEETVSKINKSIEFNITRLFNRIDFAVKLLEKITFNADASLYKESKRLNQFIDKIKKLEDKELSKTLLSRIELVKEDIKTTARRLYESSRAEEKGILRKEKPRILSTSEEIKKLGIEAASLELSLKQLAITDIDQIYKTSERLLKDLKKIELDAIATMPKLEDHFIKINVLVYLLENSTRSSIKKRINSSKKDATRIKKRITEHAKNLLKDIEIVKKIK
jgi:hypothetical protein